MDIIEFKDKGFEKVVRNFLNIKRGKVRKKDIASIVGLIVSNQPVTSEFAVSIPWYSYSSAFNMSYPRFMFDVNESCNGQWQYDLQHFSQLRTIHIYVPTKELTFLRNFSQLKELYVVGSENKDWTFIETLANLEYLYVRKCSFLDLTPIRDLCVKQIKQYETEKEKLELGRIDIFFSGLSHLSLIDCDIKDITPLADCSFIDDLNLSHNQISDISPLRGISWLYYLTLRYNQITNIEPLMGLKDIYLINLRHNQISNIDVFTTLERGNLSRLFLGDNPITDFSPIQNIRLVAHDIEKYDRYASKRRKK